MALHRLFRCRTLAYLAFMVTLGVTWLASTGVREQPRIYTVYSHGESLHLAGLPPPQGDPDPAYKPLKGIILNSKYRAGSTFSSEFFNQNKDMFFLYEPLYILNASQLRSYSESTLKATLDCDMSKLNTTAEGRYKQFWIRFQLICVVNQMPGCRMGQRNSLERAEQFCRTAKYRVTKTIRVEELETLERMMYEGYKVVHVLRDPRGTMNSRNNIKRNYQSNSTALYEDSREYCTSAVMDLAYAANKYKMNDKDFIDSYLFMRYEDLAMRPLESFEKIYTFLGIEPDHNVRAWAETQDKNSRLNSTVANTERDGARAQYDPYETVRSNPASVTEKWRRAGGLDFASVDVIQTACRSFFDVAGYIALPDSESMPYARAYPSLASFNRQALFGAR